MLEPLAGAHLPQVLALQRTVFGADGLDAWAFEHALRAGHHYRAAVQDGELVGYAGLAVLGHGTAWVQTIAVRPDRHRRGIGSLLLADLLQHAGARRVWLEVAADNPARAFYLRHGFELVTVRADYYRPSGRAAALMLRR